MVLAPAPAARANGAPVLHYDSLTGVLVPRSDSQVRVDAESLLFDLSGGYAPARVTASYTMTNRAATAASPEIAFVYVVPGQEYDPQPAVSVDGEAVAARAVTDADLLRPLLDAWFDAHPDVRDAIDQGQLQAAVIQEAIHSQPAAKRTDTDQAIGVLYRSRKVPNRTNVLAAAYLLIPEAVRDLGREWAPFSDPLAPYWVGNRDAGRGGIPGLGYLLFSVPFPAGATRTVTVTYTQETERHQSGPYPLYGYEYMLTPAARWAGFGALTITVQPPEGQTVMFANLPFRRDGDGWRAHLTTLPKHELYFTIRPAKGLIFGRTPNELLGPAVLLWTLAIGLVVAVLLWFRRLRRPRGLAAWLGAQGLGFLLNGAAMVVLWLVAWVFDPVIPGFPFDWAIAVVYWGATSVTATGVTLGVSLLLTLGALAAGKWQTRP